MNPKRIRVLVVDDSSVVRHAISDALKRDPEIEVVGTAADAYDARDKILSLHPDVLTLDIEMPRMDGLTFLRILQQHRPLPVVIVSSLTQAGSRAALDAMEAGAVDVIAKPTSAWGIGDLGSQLCQRVKGAAVASLQRQITGDTTPQPTSLAASARFNSRQIILLGASTGGTEALKYVLTRLPDGLPGICIVQHIPPVFSRTFAERLNEVCAFEVREAVSGDEIQPGLALVAPGDYHMMIFWDNGRYRVVLNQGPAVHYTRPAVDMLFNSAAACVGRHAVAALLTGMGSDGARGMKKLQAAGAATFAQNEATCVVYGMPRAAVELGAADRILPLDEIPDALVRSVLSQAAHDDAAGNRKPSPSPKNTHSIKT
jgi:two-component system, chemotaxis family, protein-glutamate methylesterase/glutaminase